MYYLPAEVTVYTVGELVSQWRDWISSPHVDSIFQLNSAPLESVDSAGMQLLLSLSSTLDAQGRSLQICDVGAPLRQACTAFGLEGWLQRTSDVKAPT